MKYYSEVTKKFYDTAEACNKAEVEMVEKQNVEKLRKEKEAAERKAAADQVEAARKAYVEAHKNYKKVLTDFCEKYGPYHTSLNKSNADDFDIFDIFHWL